MIMIMLMMMMTMMMMMTRQTDMTKLTLLGPSPPGRGVAPPPQNALVFLLLVDLHFPPAAGHSVRVHGRTLVFLKS